MNRNEVNDFFVANCPAVGWNVDEDVRLEMFMVTGRFYFGGPDTENCVRVRSYVVRDTSREHLDNLLLDLAKRIADMLVAWRP